MRYLTTYVGDEVNFKFGNTGSILKLKAIDNHEVKSFDEEHDLKIKVKNEKVYVKTVDATSNGREVLLPTSSLIDLPVGQYDLELWAENSKGRVIYPDEGFLKLSINGNATQLTGDLFSSLTLADLEKEIEDALKLASGKIDEKIDEIIGGTSKIPQISVSDKGTLVVDGKDTGTVIRGEKGDPGRDGNDGSPGKDGHDGANGESAYDIAKRNGFRGTEKEFANNVMQKTYVNVKSFEARGDGENDDTELIQKALDSVKNGGTVYFPSGKYKITKAINVYPGVTLVGDSQVSTQIIQKENNAHVIGTDIDYVTIKDITFEGAGMDSAGGGGLYFGRKNKDNIMGINIENVTVQHCAGTGITINCPITSVFTNVRVLGCVGHGFDFYGSGTSVTMNNCYAITCTQAGFNLSQLNYSVLNGCAAEVCGIGYMLRDNCNNVSLVSCGAEDQIKRNSVDGIDYLGVDFQIEGGVGNTLTSCYSRGNAKSGILVKSGSLIISGYRQIGKSEYGIFIEEGAKVYGINVSVESELVGSLIDLKSSHVDNGKDLFVNINDYGAKAEDPNFDNATAFNKAIDSLPPVGGTIFIPNGNYFVKTPINVNKSYVHIMGLNNGLRSGIDPADGSTQLGGGGAKVVVTEPISAFKLKNNKNGERLSGITFSGFDLRGDTNNGVGIDGISNTDRVIIDNMTINNIGIGVRLHAADAPKITNSWISETQSSILLTGASQQAEIKNNSLGAQPKGVTVLLENPDRFNVGGNNIYPDGAAGIRMMNPVHGNVSGNTISSYYTGVIEMLANSEGVTGNGNVVSGNVISVEDWHDNPDGKDEKWGIIHMEAFTNIIANNNIIGNNAPKNSTGILIMKGDNNRVSNNLIMIGESDSKVVCNGAVNDTRVIYSCFDNEFQDGANSSNRNISL